MQFRCACGQLISDTADSLPYKGLIVPDQDVNRVLGFPHDQASSWLRYTRAAYQCSQCDRFFVADGSGVLHSFVPEEHSPKLLSSDEGDEWMHTLVGVWNDDCPPGEEGGLSWEASDPTFREPYDTWTALRDAYFHVLEQLEAAERLRSASLERNGESVNIWPESQA